MCSEEYRTRLNHLKYRLLHDLSISLCIYADIGSLLLLYRQLVLWNFVREISEGDLVLAYSRSNTIAYVGEVKGSCKFNRRNSIGDPRGRFDYSHQREVEWWDEPHHFNRHDLPKYFADQFGKRGVTVAEIKPNSKGFAGFIKVVKVCANSGSKLPGINEDAIKAGLVKYLYLSLDRLEKGLTIKNAEVAIGKKKRDRDQIS